MVRAKEDQTRVDHLTSKPVRPTDSLAAPSSGAITKARSILLEEQRRLEELLSQVRLHSSQLRDELVECELQSLVRKVDYHSPARPSPDTSLLRLQLDANVDREKSIGGELRALRVAVSLLANLDQSVQSGQPLDTQTAVTMQTQLLISESREQERKRLAREIHDGPAQVMINAIYGLRVAEEVARNQPAKAVDRLRMTRELLLDGAAELRRFMFDLHPVALVELGLPLTLRRYALELTRIFGCQIQIDCDDDMVIEPPSLQLALFRIAQEAIRNAQKHAGEVDVSVVLTRSNGELRLVVHDNGSGFDPRRVKTDLQSGAGLILMRERAMEIGAEIQIESQPGIGTTISVVVPIPGNVQMAGSPSGGQNRRSVR